MVYSVMNMFARTSALLMLLSLLLPLPIAAQESAALTVTPVVIDEKAKARDILKQTVMLKNNTDRRLNIYPSVNDIDAQEGEQGFVSAQDSGDRSASLANWIELSRGVVELDPGQEKEIPFVIRVNMSAVPGKYHAQMTFAEGGDRVNAEIRGSVARVTVNLEVQADIKEMMQLKTFFTDNVFFAGDDVLFSYQLENIGNQDLLPRGEIRIYNRRGEEVASVPVNGDGKTVAPEQLLQTASVWSAVSGFGKYKAFMTVDYGRSQTASVQDTIYFWIIPWQQLLAIFVGSLIAVIVSAFYFHRYLERRHHAPALVAAGVGIAVPVPTAPTDWMKKDPLWKRALAPLSILARVIPKRRVKAEVAPVAPAPTPVPTQTAPAPVVSAPVVTAPVTAPVVAHTIDLKSMRGAPTQPSVSAEPAHGHVINLKKK